MNLMRHPQQTASDAAHLLLQVGRLWNAGVTIDWPRFYGEEQRNRIPLPTYPFDRRRFWIDEEGIRIVHSGSAAEGADIPAQRRQRPGGRQRLEQPRPGIRWKRRWPAFGVICSVSGRSGFTMISLNWAATR